VLVLAPSALTVSGIKVLHPGTFIGKPLCG